MEVLMDMPINRGAFEKLPVQSDRTGGKKVDWEQVVAKINKSGQYYSAKEVRENMLEEIVTLFRTRNALNERVVKGLIARRHDGRRWWYGPLMEITKKNAN
jgi:hypothetical protein